MFKLYSQIWSVTTSQQVHKWQKLHIKADRSNISGLFIPGWCSVNFAWNSYFNLYWDFHAQGFLGGVEGRGGSLEGKKQPQSSPLEEGPPWWAEDPATGHLGEAGEAGAVQAGEGGLRRDVLITTADGYTADRTRPLSGVNSKRARRNGHKLVICRAILHESGQALESVLRKLKGSPALEIFKIHLVKAMSNLVLIFNVTLFLAGRMNHTISKIPLQPIQCYDCMILSIQGFKCTYIFWQILSNTFWCYLHMGVLICIPRNSWVLSNMQVLKFHFFCFNCVVCHQNEKK